jgi:hypothetical protein
MCTELEDDPEWTQVEDQQDEDTYAILGEQSLVG